jgi:hypothetical protein
MSFGEDQKMYLKGLRSDLKTREKAASDNEEEQAVSFLQSVVDDSLELNDLQTRLHNQSELLRNGRTAVKIFTKGIYLQSSYDALKARKGRIRRKLRRQTPKILTGLLTLKIDPSPYLLDLLQAGAVSTELPKTAPSGSGRAAPSQQQPSSGASSRKTTPNSTNKEPYQYKPTDEAHERMAKVVRDIGVNAKWKEVVARIDEHYADDIPFIVPGYYSSLPKGRRPPLAEAMKPSSQIKERFQKVLRDVRKEVRREPASQQQP